ncbi:hypothetical protein VTK56DRAFT_424 [Thermocarpiscus australiensis]
MEGQIAPRRNSEQTLLLIGWRAIAGYFWNTVGKSAGKTRKALNTVCRPLPPRCPSPRSRQLSSVCQFLPGWLFFVAFVFCANSV